MGWKRINNLSEITHICKNAMQEVCKVGFSPGFAVGAICAIYCSAVIKTVLRILWSSKLYNPCRARDWKTSFVPMLTKWGSSLVLVCKFCLNRKAKRNYGMPTLKTRFKGRATRYSGGGYVSNVQLNELLPMQFISWLNTCRMSLESLKD